MQDDEAKLLPIAEFADNNCESNATRISSFFANKELHLQMPFSTLEATRFIAWERIQQAKANNIADQMKKVLGLVTKNAVVSRQRMTNQAN